MLTAFTFIRPFWLLALIPALAICVMLWRRNDPRGIWPQHIAPHLLPHLLVKGQGESGFGPLHLLPLIWSLMVLALAGPAWRPAPSPFAASDAAVMVVLKVTPSMTATDTAFPPRPRPAETARFPRPPRRCPYGLDRLQWLQPPSHAGDNRP